MKIKITQAELSHLIKDMPINYFISAELAGDKLITKKGTWEYEKLMEYRKKTEG